MTTHDPRVDTYIEQAAPFARPILEHLRASLIAACPSAEETIKWSMPFYMYRGKMFANIAAYKQHCAFRIWNGREAAAMGKDGEAMGQFGRITAIGDLPPKRELVRIIQAAAAMVESGATTTRASKPKARQTPISPT